MVQDLNLLCSKAGSKLVPLTLLCEVPSGKLEPVLITDHAAGGGPRSCDLGTKQLTRLSRSGGAVGREGVSLDDARALGGG
jgi:hypothetical protein